MLGNCHMVLAMLKRCEAEMAAGLASNRIIELAKGLDEIISRQISGKSHTAMTSSRT